MSTNRELIDSWRERLRALGIKQYQFCEMFDINLGTFNKIANGRVKNPTIDIVDRIELSLKILEDDY